MLIINWTDIPLVEVDTITGPVTLSDSEYISRDMIAHFLPCVEQTYDNFIVIESASYMSRYSVYRTDVYQNILKRICDFLYLCNYYKIWLYIIKISNHKKYFQ